MPKPSQAELLQRLQLCETVLYDMADLTQPCRIHYDPTPVCTHIPNRIINTDVGCVFKLAMDYVRAYPTPVGLIPGGSGRQPR